MPEPGLDREPSGNVAQPRRRRRTGTALLASLAIVAVFAAAALFALRGVMGGLLPAKDFDGPGTREAIVKIEPGDTAGAIGKTMESVGVVGSAEAFRKAAAANPESRSIQPGTYRLKKDMKATAALALLLNSESRVRQKVVVPEGATAAQIAASVADSLGVSDESVLAVMKEPTALGLPDYAEGRVEGFLYPATYSFEPGTTPTQALTAMVERYEQAVDSMGFEEAAASREISQYELLTVASIVQAEAKLPEDFPKVARVIYNRLDVDMRLEMDSTINYVLDERKVHLSIDDTEVESEFNTYRTRGLPPTPINSPGEMALRAAMHPAPGDWIYFVTVDKEGRNAFSESYEEFLRNKRIGEEGRGD